MRTITRIIASLLCCTLICRGGFADQLKLSSGATLDCVVLQETDSSVTVLFGDGILRIPRSTISELPKASSSIATPPNTETRIPAFSYIVQSLAKQTWAIDLHPIPSTVIDVGTLKHVPYKSLRVANDCEVNVYGDPRHPACVEIGLVGKFVDHDRAKDHCINFVSALLADAADQRIVRALDKQKDLVRRGSLTFEITPPTAEDAYGGWWVSIYDEESLDKARAKENELAEITVMRNVAARTDTRRVTARSFIDDDDWTERELRLARPSSSTSSSGGGRVYVRGYYRKDGTYVRPHTRSR